MTVPTGLSGGSSPHSAAPPIAPGALALAVKSRASSFPPEIAMALRAHRGWSVVQPPGPRAPQHEKLWFLGLGLVGGNGGKTLMPMEREFVTSLSGVRDPGDKSLVCLLDLLCSPRLDPGPETEPSQSSFWQGRSGPRSPLPSELKYPGLLAPSSTSFPTHP